MRHLAHGEVFHANQRRLTNREKCARLRLSDGTGWASENGVSTGNSISKPFSSDQGEFVYQVCKETRVMQGVND